MNPDLQHLLRCSHCGRPLDLKAFTTRDEEVDDGLLACRPCDRLFPIIDGIPRMLSGGLLHSLVSRLGAFSSRYGVRFPSASGPRRDAVERESVSVAKGFEFEWSKYTEARDEDERELYRYLGDVLAPDDFRGRLVLDAGCGQGRLAHFVAKFGARMVVGVDLSEAVLKGQAHLRTLGGVVHTLQADICDLPFGACFDVVYSVGVLHHLPDPERGFRELTARVRPGGKIFIWTYGDSAVVPALRLARRMTTRIPRPVMWPASALPAAGLYALNLLYRGARRAPGLRGASNRIPFHQYSDQSFRKLWITAFDHLTTPVVHYYRRDEMEGWLERAGLSDRIVSERWTGRAGSTWRACGTRPVSA